nr:alanine--tRNA ligase [Ipomoea batatas]
MLAKDNLSPYPSLKDAWLIGLSVYKLAWVIGFMPLILGVMRSLGLPADTEAKELWLKCSSPETYNFWEDGRITGPCGPCKQRFTFDRIGNRDAASFVNNDDPNCGIEKYGSVPFIVVADPHPNSFFAIADGSCPGNAFILWTLMAPIRSDPRKKRGDGLILKVLDVQWMLLRERSKKCSE